LVGEGEREGGALDSFLLNRLARDLDFEGERVRSPKTGAGIILAESTTGAGRVLAESTTEAGRTLAESMLGVPSFSEAGGLGLCSLSAVTVILGLLCSSATRSWGRLTGIIWSSAGVDQPDDSGGDVSVLSSTIGAIKSCSQKLPLLVMAKGALYTGFFVAACPKKV
jgi:hypothetical protein